MSSVPEHSLQQIAERLKRCRSVAILAHVRPDGDAVGSVLALAASLEQAGIEVHPMLEDPVPTYLRFLNGVERLRRPSEPVKVEVAIALDTGTKERLGEHCLRSLECVGEWINIDHHPTNPGYGSLNHVDSTSPATGQLIYDLLKAGDFPITDAVRECVYAAMATDTGSFQYSNTNARTHEIAAEMILHGLDSGEQSRRLFQSQSLGHVRLLGRMLEVMQLSHGVKVASARITRQMMSECGAGPEDTEGLIDVMRSIEPVLVAVIFEELADGRIRVSSRSKTPEIDVSKVCSEFGGGGHRLAAGTRMPGPIAMAATRFLAVLEDEVQRLD